MVSLVSASTAQAMYLMWIVWEQFIEDTAQSKELRETLDL